MEKSIVRFDLGEETWHGYKFEQLACECRASNEYRVDVNPFFVTGISKGDIVRCEEAISGPVFKEIIEKSGNSTYRLVFNRTNVGGEDLHKGELIDLLTALKPISDISDDFRDKIILYSLSASPDNVREVTNYLEKYASLGVIDYEEADFGGEKV